MWNDGKVGSTFQTSPLSRPLTMAWVEDGAAYIETRLVSEWERDEVTMAEVRAEPTAEPAASVYCWFCRTWEEPPGHCGKRRGS